ncbi:MAG: hypothetical protein J7E00_16840, partial [Escherichia coli]|nr:hypothetical protein [Escherichia coli]
VMFSNMTRFHYGYRREVRYQGNGRFTKFQLLLMKTQAVFARREIALEGIKKTGPTSCFFGI